MSVSWKMQNRKNQNIQTESYMTEVTFIITCTIQASSVLVQCVRGKTALTLWLSRQLRMSDRLIYMIMNNINLSQRKCFLRILIDIFRVFYVMFN